MHTIFPQKLKHGDEIRVIAPSKNLNIISKSNINLALKKLKTLGLKVTFGKNVRPMYCNKFKNHVYNLIIYVKNIIREILA